MEHHQWDWSKSAAKADAVVIPVGIGATVVALLRTFAGERLPWTPEQDAWVAGVIVAALAWVVTYLRDKRKHGGFKSIIPELTPERAAAQSALIERIKTQPAPHRQSQNDNDKGDLS